MNLEQRLWSKNFILSSAEMMSALRLRAVMCEGEPRIPGSDSLGVCSMRGNGQWFRQMLGADECLKRALMALTPRTSRYNVKKGDTLWSIANEQYGDSSVWFEIKNADRLAKGNLILVGQTLQLPHIIPRGPLSGGAQVFAACANRPRPEAILVAQQFANPTLNINLTKHVTNSDF